MRIVLVSQQVPHYTGGRYYAYQVACNLSLLGHEVTLLVDRGLDHIVGDYDWVSPAPRIVKGNLMGGIQRLRGKVGQVDLAIGVPIQGVYVAAGLASANNCPMWVFIYDPPPLLVKFRGDEQVRETMLGFWSAMQETIVRMNAVTVTLGKCNVKPTSSWLGRGRVTWLHPAVNDHHSCYFDEREQWATWISRIVPHKKFPHALDAVKMLNLHFNVFCSRAHGDIVKSRKMADRVTWMVNQPDRIKFETLAKSMVLVHTATYEGFGMPLIEAMYCGVPVVCYDLDIFQEVVKGTSAIVKMVSGRGELPQAIGSAYVQALEGNLPTDKRFGMSKQRRRLKALLERFV